MPFTLPASTGAASLTDAATTEAQQKTNFTNLRGFIAEMLGTDSTSRDSARSLLGIDPPTFTATVAANALTIALKTPAGADPSASAPLTHAFRSATLGSGALNVRKATSALSLVVPSGATLGSVNAVQSRLIVLAIDNSGTIELAVVGNAGSVDLTETGLISTTAISAGSSSAAVVYSTVARTNVPYRVLGYIESTQATAGTWATAPSTIQVANGNAVESMSSLGYGQSWQSVTRNAGTTYYNTTGRPIVLNVTSDLSVSFANVFITVDGVNIRGSAVASGAAGAQAQAIIPPGKSYVWNVSSGTTSNVTANELR